MAAWESVWPSFVAWSTCTVDGFKPSAKDVVRAANSSSICRSCWMVCRQRAEATSVSAGHPAASRRILVVDDSVDSAESLAKVLRVLGHVVHTAYDGQSALEAARLNAPDIVMLDIGMPRMDGFEVARRMRNDPALKDVFLVALTGYGQDEDRRQSQKSGFNAHFVKPVLLDHLRGVLENAPAPSGPKNDPTPQ